MKNDFIFAVSFLLVIIHDIETEEEEACVYQSWLVGDGGCRSEQAKCQVGLEAKSVLIRPPGSRTVSFNLYYPRDASRKVDSFENHLSNLSIRTASCNLPTVTGQTFL